MLDFLSQERALIAAFIIFILFFCVGVSVYVGLKQAVLRSKDEVFGEIAIFSDRPRMAGAIALVNSDLTMVPKQYIRGKFDASDPYFQIGLKSLFAFLS